MLVSDDAPGRCWGSKWWCGLLKNLDYRSKRLDDQLKLDEAAPHEESEKFNAKSKDSDD